MAVVGFDFGTTNSLISVIEGGRAIRFLDEQDLPIPSVVCYEGSKVIVGREARERLPGSGLGIHDNIVRSPKTLLGQESVFVGGVQKSPVDIVRDVVEYVRSQAVASRRRKDLTIDKAVVTIPINMLGYRRAALRDAFRLAGISVVQFVHEPLAALYAHLRSSGDHEKQLRKYERQNILVVDWGGGTLDLTLCRLSGGMLVQIENDGTDVQTEEVGGDKFDEELQNALVKLVRESRGLGQDVQPNHDAERRLRHFAESAKIALSAQESTQVFVRDFFAGIKDPHLTHPLSRTQMEEVFKVLLNRGFARVTSLLDRARLSPASISMCLATGGMANMPAIRSRLHQLFGPDRVEVSERSSTLISEGAAWVAHDNARLTLAKNIEVLLARNTRMPLIKAETEMPREGEVRRIPFHLYCADPRDGHAKFQFEMPKKPGKKVIANDPREVLDTLTVQVDHLARPLTERLELDMTIDDNLILHANARSLNRKDSASAEIHKLEFALALPGASSGGALDGDDEGTSSKTAGSRGGLVMRSNIANERKDFFVPGELLYQFDPYYFDVRRETPEVQVLEHLYYQPCSICRRASNDPLCRCATAPQPSSRKHVASTKPASDGR